MACGSLAGSVRFALFCSRERRKSQSPIMESLTFLAPRFLSHECASSHIHTDMHTGKYKQLPVDKGSPASGSNAG